MTYSRTLIQTEYGTSTTANGVETESANPEIKKLKPDPVAIAPSLIAGGIILIGYRTSVRRLFAILDAGGGQKDALTWGALAIICLAAAILAVVFINRQGQPL